MARSRAPAFARLPVRRRAVGAGEHRVRLLAQIVNPAGLIGPPAGIVVIAGRHGPGFGLLQRASHSSQRPVKLRKSGSASHTVWSRSFGPARKSGKAGATVGQAASSTGKRSCFW